MEYNWGDFTTGIISDQTDMYGEISLMRIESISELKDMEINGTGNATKLAVMFDETDFSRNGIFRHFGTLSGTKKDGVYVTSNVSGYWVRIVDETQPINVKWFGVKGDGTTDDKSKIEDAILACKNNSWRRLYFPAGTYNVSGAIAISTNIIFSGDSPDCSILSLTAAADSIYSLTNSRTRVEINNLGFDLGSIASAVGIKSFGNPEQSLLVESCHFWNIGANSTGIRLDGYVDAVIEHCRFENFGHIPDKARGIAIFLNAMNIAIRYCDFQYMYDSILFDYDSVNPYNHINVNIEGCYMDGHWYHLDYYREGSGASVTYSNASSDQLIDTSADFTASPAISTEEYIRVMPEVASNTSFTSAGVYSFVDTATDAFIDVHAGDIIVVSLTGDDVMAFVKEKIDDNHLELEGWIFREGTSSYHPAAPPSSNSYIIYTIVLGEIDQASSSSSSDRITMEFPNSRTWFNLRGEQYDDGGNAYPAAQTRYEIMRARPNYGIHLDGEEGVAWMDMLKIRYNTLFRGLADQIGMQNYGSRAVVSGNTIWKGQDVGITCSFHGALIKNNQVKEQGGLCIWTDAENCIISSNMTKSAMMINNLNDAGEIGLILTAKNNLVTGNITNGDNNDNCKVGLSVRGDSGGSTDNNALIGNISLNHQAGSNPATIRFFGGGTNNPSNTSIKACVGNEANQVRIAPGTTPLGGSVDWQGATNPSTGDGIPGNIGSLFRSSAPLNEGLYVKDGTNSNNWSPI